MFIYYTHGCYARHLARRVSVDSLFPNNDDKRSRRRNSMPFHVNWGCGPSVIRRLNIGDVVLNRDIGNSVRKLRTFAALDEAGIAHPRIVTDPQIVLPDDPRPFYQRGRYLGRTDGLSGGAGITIYEAGQLPAAGVVHDFFSQVVSKSYELRIHVAKRPGAPVGEIICEQFKFVPQGSQTLIRNYYNGARFTAAPLETRLDAAIAAQARAVAAASILACGLDFGAVDMAVTRTNQVLVFETNSAPRLSEREDEDDHEMPSTFDAYLAFFREFVAEAPPLAASVTRNARLARHAERRRLSR